MKSLPVTTALSDPSSHCNIIHTHTPTYFILLVLLLCNWSSIFLGILCSESCDPAGSLVIISTVSLAPSVDLDMKYFWKWSAFEDYLLFCFSFTVLCAVVTFLLLNSSVFVEMLGFLAVMFEAILGLPQLLQNFQNHTTKGMRYGTV